MWVRGVVCRKTRNQSLTVVACVILQCIVPFFMSTDACMMECSFSLYVKFLNHMVIQINTVKKARVINALLNFRNAFLNSRALYANNG